MSTAKNCFFGTYCRLDLTSEGITAKPHGDTIVVGQEIKLEFESYVNERGKDTMRVAVKNLGDDLLGFLPAREAHRTFTCHNDGWVCKVAPSAVGFKESNRTFWAEVAIFCYAQDQTKIFDALFDKVIHRMADGERPSLNLSENTISRLLDGEDIDHEMKPTKAPKLPKGEAYYKTKQTQSEKMILAASKRNKGCYVGAAAVFVIIIAIIVFIVLKVI